MTLEHTFIQQGIARDAEYAGRLARDMSERQNSRLTHVLALCLAPYLSLFVHESYRKLQASDPALATLLASDVQTIVARSRHSLKLFEDTARGIDGQLAYFRDDVFPAHRHRFLGNTWLPFARRWETDLGLFSYDGKLITTTHAATFHLGMEPDALLKIEGSELEKIYEQYGRYLGHLGAQLDVGEATFLQSLDSKRLNSRPHDVRAERFYGNIFDGAANPEINALLTVFQGMMNVAGSIMAACQDADDIEYSAFKLRFLTLYQILGSLRVLSTEKQTQLSSRSTQVIDAITGSPETQLLTSSSTRPFRNTLMHYNLDSRIDQNQVDLNDPLFGLVPIYFPGEDNAGLTAIMDRCISETATAMNVWSESVAKS